MVVARRGGSESMRRRAPGRLRRHWRTERGRRDLLALGRTVAQTLRVSALGLFQRGVGVDGYLSARYVPAHPDRFRTDLTELVQMLAQGSVRPEIAARLDLDRAAEAHRLLGRGVAGKIVLTHDTA